MKDPQRHSGVKKVIYYALHAWITLIKRNFELLNLEENSVNRIFLIKLGAFHPNNMLFSAVKTIMAKFPLVLLSENNL